MPFQYYRTELMGWKFLTIFFEAWIFFIYFKIPYDFTIRFYDPSLFSTFRAVLKSRF
jgi:hypothetical protein